MNQPAVKLGEVLTCASMKPRRCAHFLDNGVVPLGAQQTMGRGRHRRFDLGQAFYLILAYRLSELGVPLQKLKELISAVHQHFDKLKRPFSDGFSPYRNVLDSSFEWCFLMSRGEWIAVVPREYVAAWLVGGVEWYSLPRRRFEKPDGMDLGLCWLEVPLTPIADCVDIVVLPELDEPAAES